MIEQIECFGCDDIVAIIEKAPKIDFMIEWVWCESCDKKNKSGEGD